MLPTLRRFQQVRTGGHGHYGFDSTFNLTYPAPDQPGWACPWNYGIDQGAVGLMIENHRTGTIWRLLRERDWLNVGLGRAGFA